MEPSTSARARVTVTALVTLVVVLAEFAFLTGVYHLDDHVDVQRAASARVQGTLATWQPGEATEPVEEAVRSLNATDARGAHRLQLITQDWAATLDPAALDRVRAATARLDDGVAAEQDSVDRRASITLAVLLVVVSV